MGAPHVHAELSVKRFGGKVEDYLPIHEIMDSSKKAFGDLRHRALTHNSWFITEILERIFGATIKNSEGKKIAVREIGQWHIMEDYGGAIPSAQDFLMCIIYQEWMNNGEGGEVPPSNKGLPPFNKALLDPKPEVKTTKKRVGKIKLIALSKSFPLGMDIVRDQPSRGCGGGGRVD